MSWCWPALGYLSEGPDHSQRGTRWPRRGWWIHTLDIALVANQLLRAVSPPCRWFVQMCKCCWLPNSNCLHLGTSSARTWSRLAVSTERLEGCQTHDQLWKHRYRECGQRGEQPGYWCWGCHQHHLASQRVLVVKPYSSDVGRDFSLFAWHTRAYSSTCLSGAPLPWNLSPLLW